ncbi:MAG: Pantothenic acid transporter PanT [Firmicutes bacterium ADurb.Bin099]|jgi:uncharacterized membrane protein|nr:MAG: Pantothenic acid transporter PanT [Firmicutes bacterium ADurb.Bin099]HPY98528.1 ECF transporter S component [Clostridia bacterium]HQC68495.1 ECF transporter S component [Clostridia bacterium]
MKTRKIAIAGIMGALCIVMALTPIGYIPVGPTKATIIHIPVIVAAILEGPLVGAIVGLIFGLSSVLNALLFPTVTSYVFLNPLVSVVPRILVGLVAYFVYALFKKLKKPLSVTLLTIMLFATAYYLLNQVVTNFQEGKTFYAIFNIFLLLVVFGAEIYAILNYESKNFAVALSAAVATLTNTVLVLSMIGLIYGGEWVAKLGVDPSLAKDFLVGIGVANGIPETVGAVIIGSIVVEALTKLVYRKDQPVEISAAEAKAE